MSTDKTTRAQVKITLPADHHLEEIVRTLKAHGESGASKTSVTSNAILALPIPFFVHDKRLTVAVDYCPKCEQLVPYHNGKCETCGTALVHMTAVISAELQTLMALARQARAGNES